MVKPRSIVHYDHWMSNVELDVRNFSPDNYHVWAIKVICFGCYVIANIGKREWWKISYVVVFFSIHKVLKA